MPTNLTQRPMWRNGQIDTPLFICPALNVYLENVRRLIIENQARLAAILSEIHGETYPTIPTELIFLGTEELTPNTAGAYIRGRIVSRRDPNDFMIRQIEIEIIVCTGTPDSFELAYKSSCQFIQILETLFTSLPASFLHQELFFGWPQSPLVRNNTGVALVDMEAETQISDLTYQLGAMPRLIIRYEDSTSATTQPINFNV
jgi:hypothetical protein